MIIFYPHEMQYLRASGDQCEVINLFLQLIIIDPSKVEWDQNFVCTLFGESLQESAPFVAGLFSKKKTPTPPY